MIDLNAPQPREIWLRRKLSPVPAQTVLGSDGAMARAPMEETGWSSKIGSQWVPPSDVFQIPPDAAPT